MYTCFDKIVAHFNTFRYIAFGAVHARTLYILTPSDHHELRHAPTLFIAAAAASSFPRRLAAIPLIQRQDCLVAPPPPRGDGRLRVPKIDQPDQRQEVRLGAGQRIGAVRRHLHWEGHTRVDAAGAAQVQVL